MEIRSERPESQRGPEDWFTGDVFLDLIAAPVPPSRVGVLSVHFTPGARTAWHRHPYGQVLYVPSRSRRPTTTGCPPTGAST